MQVTWVHQYIQTKNREQANSSLLRWCSAYFAFDERFVNMENHSCMMNTTQIMAHSIIIRLVLVGIGVGNSLCTKIIKIKILSKI